MGRLRMGRAFRPAFLAALLSATAAGCASLPPAQLRCQQARELARDLVALDRGADASRIASAPGGAARAPAGVTAQPLPGARPTNGATNDDDDADDDAIRDRERAIEAALLRSQRLMDRFSGHGERSERERAGLLADRLVSAYGFLHGGRRAREAERLRQALALADSLIEPACAGI